MLKKRYLFLILIVCLFAVSAVSGAEISNETNMVVNDYDSGLIAESMNEDLLTDSYGTFQELQDEIDAVGESGTLNLTKDYKNVNGLAISIGKDIIIDGKGHYLNGNFSSQILSVYASNVILKNLKIINGSSSYGGAVYWNGNNGKIINCSFENNLGIDSTSTWGGAVYWRGKDGSIINCSFKNNSASCGGAIAWHGDNGRLINSNFTNCSSFTILKNNEKWGSSVYWQGKNAKIINCNFINSFNTGSSNCFGGAIHMRESDYSNIENCSFIDNSAINGAGIYVIYSDYVVIKNCSLINNNAVAIDCSFCNYGYISNCTFINNSCCDGGLISAVGGSSWDNGNISYCSFINNFGELTLWFSGSSIMVNNNFFYPDSINKLIVEGNNNTIIKKFSDIICDNITFEYKNSTNLSALIISNNNVPLDNKTIIFILTNYYDAYNIFNIVSDEKGIATLDKLNNLPCGIWNVDITFSGTDTYASSRAISTITVLPLNTSLTIENINSTVAHETTLTANVISNSTVNEGSVIFFDGKTQIGESKVTNGKATLTYAPTTSGEHTITAIFNSDNYLSSNDTAKLLVDSATVNVLVDSGTVGFESNFVANVKGLYSTVNEGNVKFYVGNEYLGKVPVVAGSASINYVPLIAGDHSVNVIYCDSDKFLDDEDSTSYHVSKADTKTIVNDLKGTVGHDVTITSTLTSSNKLTINEGTVTFYDGKNQICESKVTNGKATITYAPTTAGEHTITAIFNSDNYLSSNDDAVLSVKKANIDLAIADIASVLFTNPSNFAVNVNSNYKAVNEGKIKYYVNNDLAGTVNVNNGVANLDYVTTTAGSFTLVAVYDETSNYLASNATATFTVNKMPTVLSAESVIFDEKGDKTFTTDLKDDNSIGVSGQNVKIETIKYSGESRTFNGITDMNGIAEYDINNLEGGMWFVAGTYDGNGNYINSKFSDKFIVIRMDTTTNIEGIEDNPKVNHTYKLKANIHDEKKEGIVQFYLDGVDIGSIDLSKNKLSKNDDLLGICNIIFDYKLGDDDSDLYIEYTPSKAGTYTLSAVYGGTTIYKSSNETTTLIVKEESPFNVSAPDVTKYYGGDERFVVTVTDNASKPVANEPVKVTINGQVYDRKTGADGRTTFAINLRSGVHEATTEHDGDVIKSKITVKTTVKSKDVTKIFRNATNYEASFLDKKGNKAPAGTKVSININGAFYQCTINDDGSISFALNLEPGTYVLTLTNPYTGEEISNTVTILPNIVDNKDLVKYYNESKKFSVKVLDSTGNPASGQKVKFTIGNTTYESTSDSNGHAFLNVILQPGTYIVTTIYGDLEVNNTIKILPTLYDKDMQVSSSNIDEGEKEIIEVVLPDDATGKVSTTINGKEYSANVNKGKANIIISDLKYGTYNVDVIYAGDSQYNSVKGKTSFIVDKTIDLSVPDVTKYYGGSERLYVTLKDKNGQPIANAKIKININGVDYDRTTGANGQTSIALGIPAGNYTATVEYNGIKRESNVIIKSTVTGNDITKIYRNGTQYYAKFVDTKGNILKNTPVEFNINGVFYTRTTNENGIAKMNINLNPKEYIITATNPNSREMHSNVITVLSNIAENHDLTKYYKNSSQYVIRLLDDRGKPVGAGVSVEFNINGVFYTRTSNATGHVKMNINLNPGTYIITANYKGLMTSNTIIVKPILQAKDLNMKYKDGSKFEAKLVDGQGKPFAGQKITFNINGVFYDRTTGDDGIARLNINLMAGQYIITSMYSNGAAISNKVTISG